MKAYFTDLDGTLMKRDMTVSSCNRNTLKNEIKKGNKVVFCSGRPYKFVRYLADKVDPKVDVISFNGAFSACTNYPFSMACLNEMIKLLTDTKAPFILKSIDAVYCSRHMFQQFIYPINDWQMVPYYENTVFDDELLASTPFYKILVLFENIDRETEQVLLDGIKKISDIKFYIYDGLGFEAMSSQTNKARSAMEYCKANGIDVKDCVFFGDEINDLPMFKLGGTNVVMSNASDTVKESADIVIDNSDMNGVGMAIQQILNK